MTGATFDAGRRSLKELTPRLPINANGTLPNNQQLNSNDFSLRFRNYSLTCTVMARPSEHAGLLANEEYDDDAASAPNSPTGSTSVRPAPPRTSTELPAGEDYDILDEEHERENLISGGNRVPTEIGRLFGRDKNPHEPRQYTRREKRRESKKEKRKRRRKRKGGDEEGEFIYEMEEGGQISGSASSISASSEAEPVWTEKGKRARRKSSAGRKLLVHLCILTLFVTLLFAAYRASRKSPRARESWLGVKSNGTANFAPTTIMISLDGFRADFINRNLTPTLNGFIADGVSPKYMMPSFPSVTFPNHFTLASGLYPESHGVVGNTFWDPATEKEFYYTDPKRSMQPEWWTGEPFWVTAETRDVKTAIHMWPGSEAHIGGVEITHLDKFNGNEKLSSKTSRILELLDYPGPLDNDAPADASRPQIIAAYVPNVDADGHKYGPNSTEIRSTIRDVDDMMADILSGLHARNLTSIVNVVVVSDHGMATTSTERLIQFEDLVDPDLIDHTDGWPLYGLRPKKDEDLQTIYKSLKKQAKTNPNFDVYLRDKNMPRRYHFASNPRIAPLWIVPKTGWAIVTKSEVDVASALKNGDSYHPRGLHGYDHQHPLMRAIFVARGPAFPHMPGSKLDVFQNTEVYNILCDSVGLEPRPNNGTLRLPLQPVGLHKDIGGPPAAPSDPPEPEKKPASGHSDADEDSDSDSDSESEGKDGDKDSDEDGDDGDRKSTSWWQWVKDKFGQAKGWMSNLGKVGEDAATDHA